MLDPAHGVALFTDGSAWYKDRSGGWAFIAFDIHDFELVGSGSAQDTTSNRMEMTAVIEGLDAVFKSCGPADILLYSDSEYVVFGASNPRRKRKANVDLWEEINRAVARHRDVDFQHVKGHHESHYNDFVDKLAGEARLAGQNRAV
jgi:ribonuclease HI